MSEERVIISDKLNDFVSFADDAIQYGMTRILYSDITSTTFQSVSKTINFIPNWDTYVFRVSSPSGNIQFRLTSWFRIGNRRKGDAYNDLLRLTNKHVHPLIVRRMLTRLFFENQTVTVGPISMNRLGMESPHRGYLPWPQLRGYRVYNGTLIIDAENPRDASKSVIFAAVSMGAPNALVLPILYENVHGVAVAKA
jgi:hypothetical protein